MQLSRLGSTLACVILAASRLRLDARHAKHACAHVHHASNPHEKRILIGPPTRETYTNRLCHSGYEGAPKSCKISPKLPWQERVPGS